MARITQKMIEAYAKRLGLVIETNRPGDGTRRYEFALKEGRILGAVYGIREAEVFIDGYEKGFDTCKGMPIPDEELVGYVADLTTNFEKHIGVANNDPDLEEIILLCRKYRLKLAQQREGE